MHCNRCNCCGDSLEFFGYMHSLKDPYKAVDRAIQEGLFKEVPEIASDRKCIEAYVTHYPERRRKIRGFWESFQEGLIDSPRPDLLERLQQAHLWGGRGRRLNRLVRFVGAAARQDILDVMGKRYGKVFPKKRFGTSLVLNYQDVPGRTCALRFIDNRGRERFCPLVRAQVTNNLGMEGGLAMLEALKPFDRLVFATDNTEAALQLHRRNFADFDTPLKLVLYNENTDRAWQSVHASRVVFWSPDADWKVFAQAKKLGRNGFVTTHPVLRKSSPQEYFSHEPVSAPLKLMESRARPWTEALALWITDDKQREADIDAALNQLVLTTRERKDIREACPPDRRSKLDHYLGDTPVVRQALIGNKKILERSDGWFVLHSRGEECVCDALVRVEREVVDPQAQKIYWDGAIEYKGQKVPFFSDLEVIERSFVKWLRDTMVSAGLGVPLVSKQWQPKLINIAKMLSDPRTVRLTSTVGVDKAGRIAFPSFYVEKGEVVTQDTALPDVPGSCVSPPKLRAPGQDDTDIDSRVLFACAATAFVYNLLAPMKNDLARPWSFVGGPGSSADALCRHFATRAGMKQFDVEDYTRAAINKIRDGLGTRSYPSLVRSTALGQMRFWPPACHDNAFFVVDPRDAAGLATGGRWGEIYAPHANACESWPPFDDVINYLVVLQTKDYQLPEGTLGKALLEDFCSWYAVYLKLDVLDLLEKARARFRAHVTPAEAAIDLFCWLWTEGSIPLDHIPFKQCRERLLSRTRRQGIVIDDVDNLVLLESSPLLRVSRNHRLPVLNTGNVVEDFTRRELLATMDTSDGWIISKESWDGCVSKWAARKRI